MDIDKGESSDMDDKRESSSMDIDNGKWLAYVLMHFYSSYLMMAITVSLCLSSS